MKKNWLSPERVFSIFATIFLFVAFMSSCHLTLRVKTFIPSQTVVICTHAVSLLLSIFTVICPVLAVEVFVMLCESVLTTMTGYINLGIFLFYAILILMFAKGKFKNHPYQKLFSLVTVHLISLFLAAKNGWVFVFMGIAASLFYAAFFYMIYYILHEKLSFFLPAQTQKNTVIKEKSGEPLHLSEYALSERQINFILEKLQNNASYKELSEKYFVSISTVKKDFAEVYKIFSVKNLEELQLLLLQYKVEK